LLAECLALERELTMQTVDVTIVDRAISDGLKRELATRLADVLVAHDRGKSAVWKQWQVIADAVPPRAASDRGPDRRMADLDYAAWHDHIAGIRRWAPGDRSQWHS
jgi:hypothetical protein